MSTTPPAAAKAPYGGTPSGIPGTVQRLTTKKKNRRHCGLHCPPSVNGTQQPNLPDGGGPWRPSPINWLRGYLGWNGVRAVVQVQSQRGPRRWTE